MRSCLNFVGIGLLSVLASFSAHAVGTGFCGRGDCETSTLSFKPLACDLASIEKALEPTDEKISEHKAAAKACHEEVEKTDQQCQPNSNPNAQNASDQAKNYTQNTQQVTDSQNGAGGGGGQQSGCGGFGDLMKNIKPPLGKYNAECKGAQGQCKTSCEEQTKKSGQACATVTDPMKKTICMKNAGIVSQCNKKTQQACKKYEGQSEAIMGMIMNAAMQMASMMNCQEDTGLDCTKDPTNVKCLKDDTVDCKKPAYFKHPDCMCAVNPFQAGCGKSEASALADMAGKGKALGGNPDIGNGNNRDGSPALDVPHRGAAAGGPPTSGRGGGLGGGGGGKAAGADAGTGGAQKPANPDILAGDQGGGSGNRNAMGGGYPETKEGLTRAMQNAQRRQMAMDQGRATGPNGRSLWQKVNEGYTRTRGTLLPNGK